MTRTTIKFEKRKLERLKYSGKRKIYYAENFEGLCIEVNKHKKTYYAHFSIPEVDKAAGGVGSKIYEYLKWKKEMNGSKLIPLPNSYFYKTWEISRQRICEAVDKLGAAKLIKFKKRTGKSTLVRLLLDVRKADISDE